MIIVQAIESKRLLSADVLACCAAECTFKVGILGFDLLGANAWTVTEYCFSAGETVRLKVRRPFPNQGEIVDTSTIIEVEALPR